MKRFTTFTLLIISLLILPVSAQDIDTSDPYNSVEYAPVRGASHFVHSDIVNDDYEIRVALPQGYNENPDREYPVVYLLDAQWDFGVAGDLYGKLIYDAMVPHFIIVGITWAGEHESYDAVRHRDFTYSASAASPNGGGALKFLEAMETELFPFIESAYRASDDRALMGTSLGGLFTTFALLTRPDLFDRYVALSAPYVIEQNYFEQKINELSGTDTLTGKRAYIAVGDLDPNKKMVVDLTHKIERIRINGFEFKKVVFPGLGHAGIASVGYAYGLQHVFERPKLKLPFRTLRQYTGSYVIGEGENQAVVNVEKRLFSLRVSITGMEERTFYAESENIFYTPGINMGLIFLKDSTGAEFAILRRESNYYPFKKQQ